jgi:hypothetical protein
MAASAKEGEFQRELEVFRIEVESAIQYHYARQAVHLVAAKQPALLKRLNETPLFWNTSLSGLQASAMIALGRIFDPDPKNHSVTRLLSIAQRNLDIFSKEALADRKRRESSKADEFLPDYLRDVYEPTPHDIQRLKGYVAIRRRTYESNYKALRHQIFAHRSVADRTEIDALFARTNVSELQELLVFLRRLYEVLWQLFHNGARPVFRSQRYSAKHILAKPSASPKLANIQERITHETVRMLRNLIGET